MEDIYSKLNHKHEEIQICECITTVVCLYYNHIENVSGKEENNMVRETHLALEIKKNKQKEEQNVFEIKNIYLSFSGFW